MVRNAEQTASNAEASTSNSPGYCLQWSRERAAIAALFPDAATAWAHAFDRHKGDRNPPRGAMVYWTGGSDGYGHIAVSLGNGKIRSTDSGGKGKPATVDLSWPETYWGLPYAGWADNVNDVEIPGVGDTHDNDEEDDMPQYDHAAATAAIKLAAGEWKGITWDNVPAGSAFKAGARGCKIGGRSYIAVLHVTLDNVPAGTTIRLRTNEVEDGEIVETNPVAEADATGGSSLPFHVHAGKVGSGRELRFQVAADKGGSITRADAVVLSW